MRRAQSVLRRCAASFHEPVATNWRSVTTSADTTSYGAGHRRAEHAGRACRGAASLQLYRIFTGVLPSLHACRSAASMVSAGIAVQPQRGVRAMRLPQ